MKKNLVLGLVTLGAASMLCGFDSAETADSVMQKMQEASSAAEGVTMDMGMDFDVDVNMNDGETDSTLNIAVNGNFSVASSADPFAMMMDGSMSVSALGSGQDIEMKMYGVTNDAGEFETYAYTSDGTTGEAGWVKQTAEGLNMAELMETSKAMDASALADWGLTFELASEAADVDGTECYELTTVIDTDTLSTIITKTSEMIGEDLTADENVATALSMLSGLSMKIVYYVDTTTYLPVKTHIDMNDSDLTTLNALVQSMMASDDSANATTVELVLNNVSVDATTVYGAVEEITVPQEALDAIDEEATEAVTEAAEITA